MSNPADIESLIREAIALKRAIGGDTEFALFGLDDGKEWRADIGGSSVVMLGEVDGQFRGEGETIPAALLALIDNLKTKTTREAIEEADRLKLQNSWDENVRQFQAEGLSLGAARRRANDLREYDKPWKNE